MLLKSFYIKLTYALLLASLSLNAFAFDCNEKSPTFIKEGDKYFNLSNTKSLTKKQKASVKRIFSPLKKRLKGKSVVTSCEEIEGKTTKIISAEILSAEVGFQPDGRLDIRLEAYNKKYKTNVNETLNYFGDEGFNSLIKQTKKSFSFSYKIRHLIRGRPGGFHERFITLGVKNGTLTIDTQSFYNGYFAYSTKRTLHP